MSEQEDHERKQFDRIGQMQKFLEESRDIQKLIDERHKVYVEYRTKANALGEELQVLQGAVASGAQ